MRDGKRKLTISRVRIEGIKGEVAPGDHGPREWGHDGGGLDVKVTEHGITTPATNEANKVGVDAGAEERHGATGSEGAGFHITRPEAVLVPMGCNEPTEVGGDGTGGEGRGASGASFPR